MQNPEKERDNPLISQKVLISEVFHKDDYISTRNYRLLGEHKDEDGNPEVDADFSDTNLVKEYTDENFTLKDILEIVPKFLDEIKPQLSEENQTRVEVYKKAMSGWFEDELDVIVDN